MKSRFWPALDEIPAATTDLHEWRELLGAELGRCLPLLKSAGVLAREVGCPSAGGEGCPRQVVPLADGRFRAVCGQKPAECEPLDLSAGDIALFAVDRRKLAEAIARAFRSDGPIRDSGDWIMLGRHAVSAGAGIDLALLLPRALEGLPTLARDLEDRKDAVTIVATTRSLSDADTRRLVAHGGLLVALADVASICEDGEIRLDADLEVLLLPIRARLLAGERDKRVWVLPPGTRWEQLVFDLISDEVINVKYKTETRRFEPEQFGMKHRRSGRPTLAWSQLGALAEGGGSMPRRRVSRKETDPRKQKQLLSSRLRELFGLQDDPIVYQSRSNSYEARFVIRDSRPRHAPIAGR